MLLSLSLCVCHSVSDASELHQLRCSERLQLEKLCGGEEEEEDEEGEEEKWTRHQMFSTITRTQSVNLFKVKPTEPNAAAASSSSLHREPIPQKSKRKNDN